MKQRTRLMHNGDELNVQNMAKKNEKDDEIPLHRVRPQGNYLEAQVLEGDTLQAIALRFYCSISELKRINHIHKDNEIFARRIIKVPVTPFSVLTELVPTNQTNEPTPSTSNHIPQFTNHIQETSLESKKESEFSIDCNAVVLNSTLAPSIVPYTDEPSEDLSEDTKLLPQKQGLPVETVVIKELTSHGADFGLKWFHLVCLMLLLGIVIPIIYILLYVHWPEHEQMAPLHTP